MVSFLSVENNVESSGSTDSSSVNFIYSNPLSKRTKQIKSQLSVVHLSFNFLFNLRRWSWSAHHWLFLSLHWQRQSLHILVEPQDVSIGPEGRMRGRELSLTIKDNKQNNHAYNHICSSRSTDFIFNVTEITEGPGQVQVDLYTNKRYHKLGNKPNPISRVKSHKPIH